MVRTVDPVKHEARRQHILAAAASCFARGGFAETTVADICRAAGISTGSLFHYFPTKRAVFVGIFEQGGEDTAARLAEAVKSDDPWAAILDQIDAEVRDLADPTTAGLAIEVIAHAGRDEEFAALVARNDRQLCDGLATLVARAGDAGQVDSSIPPATAATWIMGLIDAMYTRAGIDPAFVPLEQLSTVRLILSRFLQVDPTTTRGR